MRASVIARQMHMIRDDFIAATFEEMRAEIPGLNQDARMMDLWRASLTEDADSRQAEYFLRLLVQNYRELDRRIDEHQRVVAIAEARGAVQRARGMRRVMRIEEHERQTRQGLIDRLQQRFPLPSQREVRSPSPERRLVAR